MTKSYILLKYLVLTCLLMGAFPAEATCTTHTTQLEPASLVSDNSYQLAKIWFLPDWQSDTRSYNTNVGNNVDEENSGGDVEKTCETYGFASPDSIDLSLYDCSDYDIKPLYGLECYTGCVCKPKFQYDDDNCDTAAGYVLSGSSCGGKYESCVCSGECCSDDMCGSNQSCVNNVCEDNCAALPSGWQELPCADADLQADTMDNECGGYYYKCLTPQEYCENQGYDKESCDNGVVQDSCDKDGSYVKCQECNVMKAGWQETPCSDPDLQSGKEDNGCGGYYYQCMSTGEYCESKGFKKQECEAGEEATVCDKDSSYKTCTCVPLSDEDNCSWGTKNCDNACGGTRSCCKTAAEYCTEKGFKQQTCSSTDIVTKCEADGSYVQCETNPDCQVTPVTVPANGYCSTTNSCDICTDWKCKLGYKKDGNACIEEDCSQYETYPYTTATCTHPRGYQGGPEVTCGGRTYRPCACNPYQNFIWNGSSCICQCGYVLANGNCEKPNCKIGDILYSDTTCSSSVISEKTPIGVVAYVSGNRGFAVALDEFNTPWGYVKDYSCIENTKSGYEQSDFNGFKNTQCVGASSFAIGICSSYKPSSASDCIGASDWYLPATGELYAMVPSYAVINETLKKLSKKQLEGDYWASSEFNSQNAWSANLSTGYMYVLTKQGSRSVRCVLAF